VLSQLGPYLIDEELAQGGMARVFRARLRGLGGFEKVLVIKQIRAELASDPRFVELFVREANTLVSLSHPHIVPVYELGAAEGTYYLSMEYVEGATVLQMLDQGPLAPALVAHVGAQVSEALEYAHSRFGILHRDITPRNIIVDRAGHTRVVDFGIASSADTIDPALFGSPGYMAPEQVERRRATAQSDLFSLGAVLFEALAGRPAFPKTPRGSLEPAPRLEPAIPESLAQLVLGMLAPAAEDRPKSAAEVARALRACFAQTHPHGVLEDMQRRVREASTQAAPSAPAGPPAPAEGTARIEARAIATSPVLTEILRSSAFAPVPKPPGRETAAEVPETRPLSGRSPAREPGDRTDARLTAWLLRAWPALALLALVAAFWARAGSEATRAPEQPQPAVADRVSTPNPPSSAPTPVEPAPVKSSAPNERSELDAGMRDTALGSSLSLNAKPWANVSLDGRSVGVTPLRKLKLRAGLHTLTLSCPPLGQSASLKLEFAASQHARVVVDLTQNPPRTFLDGVREAR
jgi:eukaryotic-like serine/threonine-protein kinase